MRQIYLIILIGALVLGLIFLAFFWPVFYYVLYEGAETGRLYSIPCNSLPTRQQAEVIFANHNETIVRMSGGWVSIEDASWCPGKAILGIYYGTESQKERIKQLIGEDFYGIPIRWINV